MTTKEKIEQIIEKRYKNYQGNANAQFKQYHDVMRFFVSDEKFLEFLEKMEVENPVPVFRPFEVANTRTLEYYISSAEIKRKTKVENYSWYQLLFKRLVGKEVKHTYTYQIAVELTGCNTRINNNAVLMDNIGNKWIIIRSTKLPKGGYYYVIETISPIQEISYQDILCLGMHVIYEEFKI